MKGDLIQIGDTIGQILRITFTILNKVTIVELFDGTRVKVDLCDYVWDEEKKVWKK
jgi:hypothetical protein